MFQSSSPAQLPRESNAAQYGNDGVISYKPAPPGFSRNTLEKGLNLNILGNVKTTYDNLDEDVLVAPPPSNNNDDEDDTLGMISW